MAKDVKVCHSLFSWPLTPLSNSLFLIYFYLSSSLPDVRCVLGNVNSSLFIEFPEPVFPWPSSTLPSPQKPACLSLFLLLPLLSPLLSPFLKANLRRRRSFLLILRVIRDDFPFMGFWMGQPSLIDTCRKHFSHFIHKVVLEVDERNFLIILWK